MASDIDNLVATRSALIAKLNAAMLGTGPGGIPNAQGAGSVDHMGYIRELRAMLNDLNEQISILGGPFELETRMP